MAGITHTTTGTGTKVTDAVWIEAHTIDGDIVPDTDASYDLGSSSKSFTETHTQNVIAKAGSSLNFDAEFFMYFKSLTTTRMTMSSLDGTSFAFTPQTDNQGYLGTSAKGWHEIHAYTGIGRQQTTPLSTTWLNASVSLMALTNRNANTGWVDIDCTANTSASAKWAYVKLILTVDTATQDYTLSVRKNGTTPDEYPQIIINADNAQAGDIMTACFWVAMDSDQIFEYDLTISGGQCDIACHILAYAE